MLELSYALTEAQYIAAQRLHISIQSRGQKWLRWLTQLLGAGLVVGGLYEGTYWLALGGLIAVLSPWLNWTFTTLPRLMQTYRNSPVLQQTCHIELRDGLLHTSSEQGSSTLPWGHIIRWAEDERSLLLYLQPQLFIILPKEADAQSVFIPQLREQLQRHERAKIK